MGKNSCFFSWKMGSSVWNVSGGMYTLSVPASIVTGVYEALCVHSLSMQEGKKHIYKKMIQAQIRFQAFGGTDIQLYENVYRGCRCLRSVYTVWMKTCMCSFCVYMYAFFLILYVFMSHSTLHVCFLFLCVTVWMYVQSILRAFPSVHKV